MSQVANTPLRCSLMGVFKAFCGKKKCVKEVRIGRGAAAVECAGEACAKRGERNGMWGSCSPMTIACGVLPGERLLSLPWSPIVMVALAEVGGPGRVLP